MDASHGGTVYRIGDSGEAVAEIIGKLQRLRLPDDRPTVGNRKNCDVAFRNGAVSHCAGLTPRAIWRGQGDSRWRAL